MMKKLIASGMQIPDSAQEHKVLDMQGYKMLIKKQNQELNLERSIPKEESILAYIL